MEFYPDITRFISSAKSVQLKIPPFITPRVFRKGRAVVTQFHQENLWKEFERQ